MEDQVKKIADLITDDPDVFNEMAVGTGAIAMGPMHALGSPPSRKRRKKAKKAPGPKYNSVTGEPKEGEEVLYSDTTTEEGAEEAVD